MAKRFRKLRSGLRIKMMVPRSQRSEYGCWRVVFFMSVEDHDGGNMSTIEELKRFVREAKASLLETRKRCAG